jgi:hypothetical protein
VDVIKEEEEGSLVGPNLPKRATGMGSGWPTQMFWTEETW